MSYYQSGGYTHSNPAYQGAPAEKYQPTTGGGNPQQVAVPMQSTQVIRENPKWSWCSTGWSIFTLICCGSLCGFCGLLYSIWAYVDHKTGDYERARFKRRCSWGCTMFGLILAILVIVAIVVIIVVFTDQVWCPITKGAGYNYDGC